MSKCAGLLGCKCLRLSPWKKCVKNLYPPQASGYEDYLEAHNAEDLAKLALRNEKLFVPITKQLEKNIMKDLRKMKYGYVSVGISAFITFVDMCHDNLYRFEGTLYHVLVVLFKDGKPSIRCSAMTLLIKICQFKEQNDDSSNGKYFDLLPQILKDCNPDISTSLEKLQVQDTAVSVLFQLVLICPAALITQVLPMLVPVLVEVIRLEGSNDEAEKKLIRSMKTWATRCLSNIYPLVNVITSAALLNPLFTSLDEYGWYPAAFSHSVLHTLSNSKTKEAYSKPAYLHVVMHLNDLIPSVIDSADGSSHSHDEDMRERRTSSVKQETEIMGTPMSPRQLALVRNVLACVDNLLQDTRSFSLMHVQQVVDVLTSIFFYSICLAKSLGLALPLASHLEEPSDIVRYSDTVNDDEARQIVPVLCAACKQCLLTLAKSVPGGREYFDIVENVLYITDDCDDVYVMDMLLLASDLVSSRYLPATTSIPADLIQLLAAKVMVHEPERRLVWTGLLLHMLHTTATDTSTYRIRAVKDSRLVTSVIRSLFIESNRQQHFAVLRGLVTAMLRGDTQSSLPTFIPVIFDAQATAVVKIDDTRNMDDLLRYLDSAAAINATSAMFSKLSSNIPVILSQSALYSSVLPLDTVESEGEIEEEEASRPVDVSPDQTGEIVLSAVDTNDSIRKTASSLSLVTEVVQEAASFDDIVTLREEDLPKDHFTLARPTGVIAGVLASLLDILQELAVILRSDDLAEYLHSIQHYRLEQGWPETSSIEGEVVEVVAENSCDGKLALVHKEAVVQFILRSPLLLSSAVPADFAESLRSPFIADEVEEMAPQGSRLLHRLSNTSNASDSSLRSSIRESDSESLGEWGVRSDTIQNKDLFGSLLLREKPSSSFEDMMEKAHLQKDGKIARVEVLREADVTEKPYRMNILPGYDNQSVTLIL